MARTGYNLSSEKIPKRGKKIVKPATGDLGPSRSGPATYQTNAVKGSERFGKEYQVIMTAKGAVHKYKDGTSVLVKPKKGATRSVNV